MDILILVTEADIEHYEEYLRLRSGKKWTSARRLFQQLKQNLISVPVESEPSDDELLVVEPDDITDTYDLVTGRGVAIDDIVTQSEV